MSENKTGRSFREMRRKILKATLKTAVTGVFWLILWFAFSPLLTSFPGYLMLFAVLVWSMLFFTFTIKISEGTIYQHILSMIRGFFLIFYIAYATNYGVLTVKFEEFALTMEFTPILALMIVANLLAIVRGLLQAIEFAAQSPKD